MLLVGDVVSVKHQEWQGAASELRGNDRCQVLRVDRSMAVSY